MAEIDTTTDDFKQVQSLIRGEVEKYAAEAFDKQKQQVPAQTQTEQQQAQQQLRDLISPFVDPGINEAKLTAADARDYVDFYNSNDVEVTYKQQVEETFNELKKMGRPLPRTDIMNYLVGKEYRADPDKFTAKQSERKKAQLDRAITASDFGSGAVDRQRNESMFTNFDSLSVEDMAKALDGVTF